MKTMVPSSAQETGVVWVKGVGEGLPDRLRKWSWILRTWEVGCLPCWRPREGLGLGSCCLSPLPNFWSLCDLRGRTSVMQAWVLLPSSKGHLVTTSLSHLAAQRPLLCGDPSSRTVTEDIHEDFTQR